MFDIKASTKFLNLSGSIKLYYVLGFGAVVSIFSFIFFREFLITITLLVTTIIGYYLLGIKPKNIDVRLNEESIEIGSNLVKWDSCIDWAMIDLGETIEFVIHTNKLSHQFYYFYINEKDLKIKDFILNLSQFTPYNQEVPGKNPIHTVLRNFGLL